MPGADRLCLKIETVAPRFLSGDSKSKSAFRRQMRRPSASDKFVCRLAHHTAKQPGTVGPCRQRFSSTAVVSRGILPKEQPRAGSDSIVDPECRMGSEKELFEVFERIIHEDFPNPQRIDCPRHENLSKLAEGSGDVDQARLLAHIQQCAPCFDKLKELRSKARSRSPQDI